MKKSKQKQRLVKELDALHKSLDIIQLYNLPRHKTTRDWLTETASILKNLDESDYQEFVRLSKTITPMEPREKRKSAAFEIDSFIRRKVSEWKRYDFSSLDNETVTPKLTFGEPGKPGQPGGGGSIFIQTENFVNNGGRITADGGDYIIRHNELNNFGTLNQTIAETINNITKLTNVVNQSELDEAEKRQLIGDIETIKAQIIKPKPDKTILQKVWETAQVASTISGASQLLGMIGQVVLPFIK